jgi:broad specificity phosphatase PhoE
MSHTIYLIRHGATASTAGQRVCGITDVALSERGLAEMDAVARHLREKEIEAVFSSPLQRAKNPAAALAQVRGLRHVVLPELAEVDFGEWEDRSVAEVLLRWPLMAARAQKFEPEFVFPKGERISDFQLRALKAFELICADLKGPAAVYTHGGILKMIVGHVLKTKTLKDAHALDFSTGSVTELKWNNGTHEVAAHNYYGHLPPLK